MNTIVTIFIHYINGLFRNKRPLYEYHCVNFLCLLRVLNFAFSIFPEPFWGVFNFAPFIQSQKLILLLHDTLKETTREFLAKTDTGPIP